MFSAIRIRPRLSSVRARLTFWYLLTLGVCLTGFAVFVFLVRAHTLYRELDVDLTLRLHRLADELRPALFGLDVAASLSGRPAAIDAPIVVREAPDALLFRSPAFPQLDWRAERELASAVRSGRALATIDDPPRAAWRLATLRMERPGTGALAIQMVTSTEPVQHILGQLAGVMLVAIMIVLAIASYGSGLTTRRALAPVDEIVTRVRLIQAHQFGERLDVRADSAELDRLVTTLNEMLDRIEASFRSARRFAADASHELQTPMAIMRSIVDACRRSDRDATGYQRMADDLLTEIERMSALVRDLRLFTAADAGYLVGPPEPVDLANLAEQCAEIARALAEDQQIEVETTITDRPVVLGNTLHLRRAVLNLTQNAIRYSPASSTIRIGLETAGGQARLEVSDQGCGIDASDLPHIFEPFYRSDPARSRETGGTGLGLAIVDQIVRAHGGRVTVTSQPGQGSTFCLSLPLPEPADLSAQDDTRPRTARTVADRGSHSLAAG